jgi:D-beta-D-heptose 7-phosphate kinase / D-beta-D-heptose 1-phosphate adenosyltransferase
MDRSRLARDVERLSGGRVLVVGDLMLDRYVYGEVSRISPEAPIPVLRQARQQSMLGGAGNVVRNVLSLGASCSVVGILGDDAPGREIEDLLGLSPRCRPALLRDPQRSSTIKTRFVADRQQVLRVDAETVLPLPDDLAHRVLASADEALSNCDAVVLSDYGKGLLTPTVTQGVIDRARGLGKPVLVDPKGNDYSRYRGASLLTPNLKELREAASLETHDDPSVRRAALHLIRRFGVEAVIATRGPEGLSLVRESSEPVHLPAEAREVFDVSGAGDTVIATLGVALAVGIPLAEAAELANIAAGIVVGKLGTAVTTPAEILRTLHQQELSSAEARVATLEEAVARVEGWRSKGDRIAFTNGIFDLLHHGHIDLLKRSRALGDRLVVGVNGDGSARRLRGDEPIQNEAARSAILASLEMVDLVVVFQEDTPVALLEALRPDLLIKGANYAEDEVVGADLVRGYGGRVKLVEVSDPRGGNARMRELSRGRF